MKEPQTRLCKSVIFPFFKILNFDINIKINKSSHQYSTTKNYLWAFHFSTLSLFWSLPWPSRLERVNNVILAATRCSWPSTVPTVLGSIFYEIGKKKKYLRRTVVHSKTWIENRCTLAYKHAHGLYFYLSLPEGRAKVGFDPTLKYPLESSPSRGSTKAATAALVGLLRSNSAMTMCISRRLSGLLLPNAAAMVGPCGVHLSSLNWCLQCSGGGAMWLDRWYLKYLLWILNLSGRIVLFNSTYKNPHDL